MPVQAGSPETLQRAADVTMIADALNLTAALLRHRLRKKADGDAAAHRSDPGTGGARRLEGAFHKRLSADVRSMIGQYSRPHGGTGMRAIEWDGTSWDDPSDEHLHDLLADMSLTWRFVVVQRLDLEPVGQHYMQVYLNDDLSYRVEYREGGPDGTSTPGCRASTRCSPWNL